MTSVAYDEDTQYYLFLCPHCNGPIQVHRTEIRCTIFRHAVQRSNLAFVNPHAPQSECERWVREGTVYGCGKPFKFDGRTVQVCGYI